MISIRLEILSLMQSLHAIGLMPDEDFQREKIRLLPLISEEDWLKSPSFESDNARIDWKFLIRQFLTASRDARMFSDIGLDFSDEGVVSEEMNYFGRGEKWGHYATFSTETMETLRRHDYWIDDNKKESEKRVKKIEKEVSSLRAALERLTNSIQSDHQDREINTQNSISSNTAQIERLQGDLARHISRAAVCDANGDTFRAGQARGQAAVVESQLRALGA